MDKLSQDITMICLPGIGFDEEFMYKCFVKLSESLKIKISSITPKSIEESVEYINQTNGKKILVGLSIGSAISLNYIINNINRDVIAVVFALPGWELNSHHNELSRLMAKKSSEDIRNIGISGVLDNMKTSTDEWLWNEISRSWKKYKDNELISYMLEGSKYDTNVQLNQKLEIPALVLGLSGDPIHPKEYAEQWSKFFNIEQVVVDINDFKNDFSLFSKSIINSNTYQLIESSIKLFKA